MKKVLAAILLLLSVQSTYAQDKVQDDIRAAIAASGRKKLPDDGTNGTGAKTYNPAMASQIQGNAPFSLTRNMFGPTVLDLFLQPQNNLSDVYSPATATANIGAVNAANPVVSGATGILGGYNGTNSGIPLGCSGNVGCVRIVPGGNVAGYIEFDNPSNSALVGSRVGYLGYSDANGNLVASGNWVSPSLISHVSNTIALGAWTGYAYPVVRDGYATPGDGGRATYVHSTSACTIAGGDKGTQIPAPDGGCWNIDLASVGNVMTPALFGGGSAGLQAAISTGLSVHIPAPGISLTNCISQTKPGQLIYGDGRMESTAATSATDLSVSAALPSGCKGAFVSTAAEPGPIIRDLSVTFAQPDVTTLAALTQYPPAFYAQGVPRLRFEHVGCYTAIVCFDLRGNTGGSTLDDVQMSAFLTGMEFDGAYDSVRILSLHAFPFKTTPNQLTLEGANVTWISSAEVDDLKIQNPLFYGGIAMSFTPSSNGGVVTASITNPDCDTVFMCLTATAGEIELKGGEANGNAQGWRMAYVNGPARVGIHDMYQVSWNESAVANSNAAFSVDGGGILNVTGNSDIYNQYDSPIAYVGSGVLTFSGNTVRFLNTSPVTNSKISVSSSGRLISVGNYFSDTTQSGTTLYSIPKDGFNVVANNAAPGWGSSFPATGTGTNSTTFTGIYGPNAFASGGHSTAP